MEADTVKEETSEVEPNISPTKYKVIDIDSVSNGKCFVGDTNIAINGVVARIVLDRCNIDDFYANKTKYLQSEDTKIRGKKRKLQEIKLEEPSSQDANKGSLESKKKRGRPKKLLQTNPEESESSESDTEGVQSKDVKKRPRPKKSITSEKVEKTAAKEKHQPESKQLNRLNADSPVKKQRFNGGSTSSVIIHASTSRVRKPNSRFQDFVVPSAIRYFVQSPLNKPVKVKEVVMTPKEKPLKKVNKGIMDDPLKISNSSEDDINKSTTAVAPKITHTRDDVVRSFLPVFDDPLLFYESDDMEEQPRKRKKVVKEKENQVNNLQVKYLFSKNIAPKPKSAVSDQNDYSPPKLRSGNDTKSKISTPKPQKIVTKNNTTLENLKKTTQTPEILKKTTQGAIIQKKITQSPEILKKTAQSPAILKKYTKSPAILKKTKQSPAVNNNTVTQQKRQKLNDIENPIVVKPNTVATKVTCDASKAEGKMNGSSSGVKQHKTNVMYVLVDSDGGRNRNKTPKVGDVDFNKLVRSLKLVKLPAANWKIRIVVSKQQTITEVTFTNKEVNERCIKFSRTITGYVITFGKSIVNLLGAPTKISSFNDVSILLDIVHNISLNDPVLEYSTSNNV